MIACARRWNAAAIGSCAIALAISAPGCGHQAERALRGSSKTLSKAVAKGDATAIRGAAVSGTRGTIDVAAMTAPGAQKAWVQSLEKPDAVVPEALIFVAKDMPVRVVWRSDGWRFAEDPTDIYAQDTPRHALRALVIASRNERWELVLGLAPKRYRMGLSEEELGRAWTEGEHAKVLTGARDTVAAHLADPIRHDAHEAVLEIAPGHVVRLEREGERWVVVDFLPNPGS